MLKKLLMLYVKRLRAEFVQAIGFKFTLYKKNTENPQIVLPGHEQAKAKVKAENVTKKGRVTKVSWLISILSICKYTDAFLYY